MKPLRTSKPPQPSWRELAAMTNFSFLRGASHPDEMIAAAQAHGYDAIGIADLNTCAGLVRAHVAAKSAQVRLVVGARIQAQCGFEAIFYPEDRPAYGRLCRLLTKGARASPKGQCRMSLEDLCDTLEGQRLILIAPRQAPLGPDWAKSAARLIESAPDRRRLYLGLAAHYDGYDGERFAALNGLARRFGVKGLAIQDALHHAPERRPLADVLACIREKTTIDRAGFLLAAHGERHLKPVADLVRLFADHHEAVRAQEDLVAAIDFRLDQLAYEYPDEICAPGRTPMETLADLAYAGACKRYPGGVPESVRGAIAHELQLIEQLGYAKYFLTVHDLVEFARARGILAQGRGSAANSTICYCLGVTAVDPTKVDLLFERFVSAERNEPPDIDVDFEHERREEVIQHLYSKYGRERAGLAACVIRYRGRSAIRDVGKALGLSGDMINALSRTLWGWSAEGVSDEDARNRLGLDPDSPRLRLALDLSKQISGFPRHLSQHVGGFVITRGRLDELTPIGNAAMADRTFIEWDKDDLDALGLLKVDVLALGMLSCIARAFKLIGAHHGRNLDLATTPSEDESVYDMISKADTIGVFQIESRAQMAMLPRLKPRSFYDLVIEVAIVRPGPIQGDMVHPYLRRRQGLEPVEFPSKALESVLGKTLGVPLFQEQAMRIAIVAAGFSPSEADQLRRAMATFRKVGIIHQFGLRLVEGMVKNGYERAFAERCFKQIEGFGEYGFPESHAASFALLVYVSAWIKKHYPDAFLAAILNAQPMGFYASAQLVRCAREHGVCVRPPCVNASDWDSSLEERQSDGRCAVRLGLREIKGFPQDAAQRIMAARRQSGPFADLEDLQRRAGISPALARLLAKADALGALTNRKSGRTSAHESALGGVRRIGLWAAEALKPQPLDLFAAAAAAETGWEPAAQLPPMSASEEVVHDYVHTRLSLKGHPMAFVRAAAARAGAKPLSAVARSPHGRRMDLAGIVLVRQRPGTAKGVIFMTLEDETATANLVIWPKVFARFRAEILGSRLVRAIGRVQREGDVIHVVVERLEDWSAHLAALSDGQADFGDQGLARADEARRGGPSDPRLRRARSAQAGPGETGPKEAPRQLTLPGEGFLPPSRDFH